MKDNDKEDCRQKREITIRNAEGTLDNYGSIKASLNKMRKDIDFVYGQITYNEPYLRKTIAGLKQIPDRAFAKPSPEFSLMVSSLCATTAVAYEHSKNLRENVSDISQSFYTLLDSTAISSTAVASSSIITLDAVKTLAPIYPEVEPLVRELETSTSPEQTKKAEHLLYNIAPKLQEMLKAAWQLIEMSQSWIDVNRVLMFYANCYGNFLRYWLQMRK